MKKNCAVYLLIWSISLRIVYAQPTPFSASWSFEGNLNGTSSTPLVTANAATLSNILVPNVGGFPNGQLGKTVNLQNWSDPACPGNEYIEVSVSPAANVTMIVTSLSFYYSRSAAGPNAIKVKHSLDGFATDIYNSVISAMGTPYQLATIDLTAVSGAFASQSQPVSFRIYGCDRTATNGSMRLDEIMINATALPVALLSFTAQPEGDRVQLAWVTTSEQDADHFFIERSRDLGEYTTVGEVAAKGTTDTRQYYGLTDMNPQPGINYYRLKQIDYDGTTQSFKPISAIIRADEPVVAVYPNPANPDRIHLRLWNVDDATVRLLTATGQPVSGRLERRPGEADLVFERPLPTGFYWLEVQINGQRRTIKVIVR